MSLYLAALMAAAQQPHQAPAGAHPGRIDGLWVVLVTAAFVFSIYVITTLAWPPRPPRQKEDAPGAAPTEDATKSSPPVP